MARRKGKNFKKTNERAKIPGSKSKVDINELKKSHNDPKWNTGSQRLAEDAGKIAFTWPIGNRIDMFDGSGQYRMIPGVMSFDVIPTIGWSEDRNSAANIAAVNLYSFVRHANSGHANYESQDLMMYILAMDSIYSWYAYGCRAYGTMALYAQRNRYYPRLLLTAQGWDFDSLEDRIADFRYYLNQIAVKIGSLCVPNTFSLFSRHTWLYSTYMRDSAEPYKSQIYCYKPFGYHRLVETGVGRLEFVVPDTTELKFSDYKTIMNDMLNRLTGSEDMGIMSGDILKAFGEQGVVKLNQIAENYVVTPIYDESVLEQIQNMTILDGNFAISDMDIYQEVKAGAILCKPKMHFTDANTNRQKAFLGVLSGKRILAAFNESPEPDNVIKMTRLTAVADGETGGDYLTVNLRYIGSEFVNSAKIYYYNENGTPEYQELKAIVNLSAFPECKQRIGALANMSVFAHHPMVQEIIDAGSIGYKRTMHFDVENYAIIDQHDLEKMHETSLLSLFNVPQMGSAFAGSSST